MYPSSKYLRIQSERVVRACLCGFRRFERSALTFLRFCTFSSIIVSLTWSAIGQTPQGQAPTTPPVTPPVTQAPQTTPQTTQTQTQPPAPQRNVPDYPDPRTLALGAFYWITGPGTEPGYFGGSQALDYETLTNWGKPHRTPGVEAVYPITRTGELHLELFRTTGVGNQNSPATLDIFGTGRYSPGDYLASQYGITNAKLYLDDLLFPHKFPVSKFRVKSLWEIEWVQIKSTVDAPILEIPLAGTGQTVSATGSRQIIFPAFGLAAEYALSRHVLLRATASGFGIWHKADLWDSEATISYRRGMWEIRGGAKAFHFKTSPNNTEYARATLAGAFVGLRWHWSL
jgi:hypothetical protein